MKRTYIAVIIMAIGRLLTPNRRSVDRRRIQQAKSPLTTELWVFSNGWYVVFTCPRDEDSWKVMIRLQGE